MTWERQRTYDLAQGREEGMRDAKIETAKRMLAGGLTIEQTAQFSALPIAEIEALAKEKSN